LRIRTPTELINTMMRINTRRREKMRLMNSNNTRMKKMRKIMTIRTPKTNQRMFTLPVDPGKGEELTGRQPDLKGT
jgi:hypothetical protein